MKLFKMAHYMSKLPHEEKIKVRRRLLYSVIFISFFVFIAVGCMEIFKEKKRETAVALITGEHYSLVCNGVEKPLTIHEYIQFSTEDLFEYNTFRFDKDTKTVHCTDFGGALSSFILCMSIILCVSGSALLVFTEMTLMGRFANESKNKDD